MIKMRVLCWCKTTCIRIGWNDGYWFFFGRAYDAIEQVYGTQSSNAW